MTGYLNRPVAGMCEEVLAGIPDSSLDACVTDPPYALTEKTPDIFSIIDDWCAKKRSRIGVSQVRARAGGAGSDWDDYMPGPEVWSQVYRVLKPGAYCLVFSSGRTVDLVALALRMSGFRIRDTVMWLHSHTMPKSLNLSKSIDKAAGAKRKVIGVKKDSTWDGLPGAGLRKAEGRTASQHFRSEFTEITESATEDAARWEGWGTCLKPCHDPIVVAQKPPEDCATSSVRDTGVGGLNIEGSRANGERFPGNVVLDCSCGGPHRSDCPVSQVDSQRPGASAYYKTIDTSGLYRYSPKAGTEERWAWCRECRVAFPFSASGDHSDHSDAVVYHMTQKPVGLMKYFIGLVTQPGGVVLDPFGGTFTTAVAARSQGFNFVSCDVVPDHVRIGEARLREINVKSPDALHCGAVFCPKCKANGEVKIFDKKVVERARRTGIKVTCSRCLGRFKAGDLGGQG